MMVNATPFDRRVGPILSGLRCSVPRAVHNASTAAAAPCRVAIVGLGRQGSTICAEQPAGSPPFGIAGACHASSQLELVAGCDLMPEKRAAFTELWGCASTYADFTEMIRVEKPDLVRRPTHPRCACVRELRN
eukprot:SAG11_NODE_213_length_12262_cov_8.391597_14_plen_133_part_00